MLDANNPQEVLSQRLREAEKNGACAVGIDFSYCYNLNSLNKVYIKLAN